MLFSPVVIEIRIISQSSPLRSCAGKGQPVFVLWNGYVQIAQCYLILILPYLNIYVNVLNIIYRKLPIFRRIDEKQRAFLWVNDSEYICRMLYDKGNVLTGDAL